MTGATQAGAKIPSLVAAFRAPAFVAAVAPSAPVAAQCNPPDFPTTAPAGAGREVTCTVTIDNTISVAGVPQSTVTATACLGAAGVGPPFGCTTTTSTSNQLVSGVNQCNGIVVGGGSNVTCRVIIANTVPLGTPAPGVTVNQCIGSGTGGGTEPTVQCNPTSDTTNATVTQCNGSGNGGGASMRVKCTVTGGTSATPVNINQCNGSGNGGGSTVTCTTNVTNVFVTAQTPALTIAKSASPSTVTAAGQTVHYSFLVTNSGNTTLTNVKVTDTPTAPAGAVTPVCPGSVGNTGPTVTAGQNITCTATYTVTQADIDNGSIHDSALATGTPPTGASVQSPPSPATVTATQLPALTVAKSASPAKVTAVGQTITYSFVVTNTGNVTVSTVGVTDTQTAPAGALTGPPTCPRSSLDPGQATTCTATYTVTAADLTHGSVHDSAVAVGAGPGAVPVHSSPSGATVTAIAPHASLTVKKSASPMTVTAVGQTISYTFLVTNTGNVTIADLHVTDAQVAPAGSLSTPLTCPGTVGTTGPSLAAGHTITCTATYKVTQADLTNGSVADSAIAAGHKPGGSAVMSPSSAVKVTATSTSPGAGSSGGGATGTGNTGGGSTGTGSSGGGSTGGGGATLASSGAGTGALAFTGLSLGPLLGLASILLLAGTSLLVLAQRRRRSKT